MSQEKIDQRKAEKRNRKKQLEQKKQKRMLSIVVSIIATVAFLAVICLAVAQLSGKLEPATTTQPVSYSEEELQSLREQFGITTVADENATTGDATTADTSTKETSAEETTTAAE